jgi:hypothetical protein
MVSLLALQKMYSITNYIEDAVTVPVTTCLIVFIYCEQIPHLIQMGCIYLRSGYNLNTIMRAPNEEFTDAF